MRPKKHKYTQNVASRSVRWGHFNISAGVPLKIQLKIGEYVSLLRCADRFAGLDQHGVLITDGQFNGRTCISMKNN